MTDYEKLEKLKKNILSLDWSMDEAPYHGFNSDNIKGVRFAISKVLEGTGITIGTLMQEKNKKSWFRG